MELLLTGILGILTGVGLWQCVAYWSGKSLRAQADQIKQGAQEQRTQIIRNAQIDAKAALLELQQQHDTRLKSDQQHLEKSEDQLRLREQQIERRMERIDSLEAEIRKQSMDMQRAKETITETLRLAQQNHEEMGYELERIAGLTQKEAQLELEATLMAQAREQAAKHLQRMTEEANKQAKQEGARIIAGSLERMAGEYVSERTVCVVTLPSDDMKGRIIGREGRNIRAIEAAMGVDIIVDDTPGLVVISAFNPIRREIARLSLEALIADGRIHPARIEELVQSVTSNMATTLVTHGEEAAFELGIHDLPEDLTKLLGGLKYRHMDGQNLLQHSIETAFLARMMAAELGVSEQDAARAGLLHDMGRAVDHEATGDHGQVGADIARRLGESHEVVEAILNHHGDAPPTVIASLVQAADTLSKARPGARRESYGALIKRLGDLEAVATNFAGVSQAHAVQAGRELRVMVRFEEVSRQRAFLMAQDIARHIEETMNYPGVIQVTVVRQAQATEMTR